ncbi:hypothetical protein BVC71_08010 [Marivivens niveibacter]|uniref:N-acetyltransferase domain-containing protein n=1 Tax=Marivivens niveibacter TaxID=1930667 RepID=A0A251X0C9_9RHOB|nr:GNAT family N-acetyltransferase [Marivivens niveibacter]OUD09764.1 hypothetical protein BVC71_08010 [Marivivens niveibacter]
MLPAFETINEFDLTPETEAELTTLLDLAFSPEFGGASYHQQRHNVRLIQRSKGAIVGHLAITYRTVRLGEQLLDIVGLAEVATHPNHRSQGIAGHLVRGSIDFARKVGADAMVLFGDRPVYAANGFQAKPNPLRWVAMTDKRTVAIEHQTDDLMVLPLNNRSWDDHLTLDLLGNKF